MGGMHSLSPENTNNMNVERNKYFVNLMDAVLPFRKREEDEKEKERPKETIEDLIAAYHQLSSMGLLGGNNSLDSEEKVV